MSTENLTYDAERLKKIAAADYIDPLLIGPTGVGKSRMAARIKELSPRADKPFVEVNCAEIPHSLIESELFGFEKGAFTGATALKKGKFEAAAGGTLFLDEIGELPRELQAKLLKVLEEKRITRVGGTSVIPVDIRIIYATHQDLSVFREDFLYRISSYVIRLKSLRERQEEITGLAQQFIAHFNKIAGSDLFCRDAALEYLKTPDWAGNIRQLRDFVTRVCLERLMKAENQDVPIELGAEDFLLTLTEEGLIDIRPDQIQPVTTTISAPQVNPLPYWETLQTEAISRPDRELLAGYYKLAREGKTNEEIGLLLGIKRSTLFYRLKRIKKALAQNENLLAPCEDKTRWFYYWSRGLQSVLSDARNVYPQ